MQAVLDEEKDKKGQTLNVMVRFSARGAYLLLVPQARALIRDRDMGLGFFEKKKSACLGCKTKL